MKRNSKSIDLKQLSDQYQDAKQLQDQCNALLEFLKSNPNAEQPTIYMWLESNFFPWLATYMKSSPDVSMKFIGLLIEATKTDIATIEATVKIAAKGDRAMETLYKQVLAA